MRSLWPCPGSVPVPALSVSLSRFCPGPGSRPRALFRVSRHGDARGGAGAAPPSMQMRPRPRPARGRGASLRVTSAVGNLPKGRAGARGGACPGRARGGGDWRAVLTRGDARGLAAHVGRRRPRPHKQRHIAGGHSPAARAAAAAAPPALDARPALRSPVSARPLPPPAPPSRRGVPRARRRLRPPSRPVRPVPAARGSRSASPHGTGRAARGRVSPTELPRSAGSARAGCHRAPLRCRHRRARSPAPRPLSRGTRRGFPKGTGQPVPVTARPRGASARLPRK